jgi:hypothetical protein
MDSDTGGSIMSNHERQAEEPPAAASETSSSAFENRRRDGARPQTDSPQGLGRSSDSSPSPGPEAAQRSKEITDREAFQITCLRNTHYHEDRERFFARWHKITMFVVVLGGAATFAPLEHKYWIAASIVTIAGLIDLVFDVSGKARLHASLRRRIYDILSESQDDRSDLTKLHRRAIDVYADEPPCMHAVNAIAHNAAMAAFERPLKLQFKITLLQRLLRNMWPYPSVVFKTFEELEAAGL